jgi:hypothetical protein
VEPVFSIDPVEVAVGGYDQKRIRYQSASRNVTIVGNFGVTASNSTPNFTSTGKWYEYFTGDSLQVTNTNVQINLRPGEYRIYSNRKWSTPERYIQILSLDDSKSVSASIEFYPNPSSGHVVFKIPGIQDSKALVTLRTITGQVLTTKNVDVTGKSLDFDYADLALKEGIYFIDIKQGDRNYHVRINKE